MKGTQQGKSSVTPSKESDEVNEFIEKELVDIREDIAGLQAPSRGNNRDQHQYLGSNQRGMPMNDMQRKSNLKNDSLSEEQQQQETIKELTRRVGELEVNQVGKKGLTTFDVPLRFLNSDSSLEDVIKMVNKLIQRSQSITKVK